MCFFKLWGKLLWAVFLNINVLQWLNILQNFSQNYYLIWNICNRIFFSNLSLLLNDQMFFPQILGCNLVFLDQSLHFYFEFFWSSYSLLIKIQIPWHSRPHDMALQALFPTCPFQHPIFHYGRSLCSPFIRELSTLLP